MPNEISNLNTSTPRARHALDFNDVSPVVLRPVIHDNSLDATNNQFHSSHESALGTSSSLYSFLEQPCVFCSFPGHFVMHPCGHRICYNCVHSMTTSMCFCGSGIAALFAPNAETSATSIGDSPPRNHLLAPHPAITAEWAIQNTPFYDLARFAIPRDYAVLKLSNVCLFYFCST